MHVWLFSVDSLKAYEAHHFLADDSRRVIADGKDITRRDVVKRY